MVDYVPKGGLYNFEEKDPDIVEWGLVRRTSGWAQAMIEAEELMKAPPEGMKIRVWKNPALVGWNWCLKWVPVEEES
jgi:hypothetical protein